MLNNNQTMINNYFNDNNFNDNNFNDNKFNDNNFNDNKNNRTLQMKLIQAEARNIFKKKNHDYGDAFATYGPIGVLVRMGDKISRLMTVNKNGINLINDENLRDTLIDLHNYSAMAIILLDDKIEKNKEKK